MIVPGFTKVLGDRLYHTSLAGVRFVDAHTGAYVHKGLEVRLIADSGRGPDRRAVLGPSGIYSFHDLPGMKDFERRAPDDPEPTSSPRSFALSAVDATRRFLPVGMVLTLPRDEAFVRVPVHAASGYMPPPLWAAVRGRLGAWRTGDGELEVDESPAPFGLVTVSIGGSLVGRGLADERGEFAVFFPYPDLLDSDGVTSPPTSPPPAPGPHGRTWDVTVSVTFDPDLENVPGTDTPDLLDIAAQSQRDVLTQWPRPGSPPVPQAPTTGASLAATLTYGRDATVTTAERDALWVDATST